MTETKTITFIGEDELTYPAHWRLSCSSAKRWVNCPGSQHAEESDEDAPNFMRDVGTLGHKMSECLLTHTKIEFTEEELDLYHNQLEEDERDWLKRSVKRFVRFVQQAYNDAVAGLEDGEAAIVLYEKKIQSESVDDHGGTMDVVICTPRLIHVIDAKFGAEAVEVEDNEQLKCYLNLARQHFSMRQADPCTYKGTIFQPSYRSDLTVEFTREQLDEFLIECIAASNDPITRRGDPSWCKYCPLLGNCLEAAKTSVRAVDEFGTLTEFVNKVDGVPTEEQIEELERIVMMHKLAKDAYEKASTLLKTWHNSGALLKHHRVTSSNYRGWKPTAVAKLAEVLTKAQMDDAITVDIATPPALQKILGMPQKAFDKKFAELIDLTSRPTLKRGSKPTVNELANDLPIFEGMG